MTEIHEIKAMKTQMTNQKIKKIIKDYIGTNFYFLVDYLSGGYEQYVSDNLYSIVTFRNRRTRGYEDLCEYFLFEKVCDDCERTLAYIKKCGALL